MSKKKKKCKRKKKRTMKRVDRLASAVEWIKKYEGNNIVRGYSKKFKVDLLCAVVDLELTGYKVDSKYKKQLEQSRVDLQRQREKKKRKKEEQFDMDSDDTFAFIAGYTSGGFPYGVTWDEMDSESEEAEENFKQKNEENYCNKREVSESAYWDDADDIPF